MMIILNILLRGFHLDISVNKVLSVLSKMSPFNFFCKQNLEILRKYIEKDIFMKMFLLFSKYVISHVSFFLRN